ncbi:MAG: hypothetical protein GTN55_02735 [Gammaproteobacteria bacterium]|nr:hypothetical protein [Gammaproteobacteria bacterium]NIT05130.1 hypothetical protein [Gammaproteobacteria bacterium]
MDAQKLNDWMQVIGIFSVVVSLVFVGYQLKQSQDIAVAGQNQERQSVALDYYASLIEVDEIVDYYGARHREHLEENVHTESRRSDRMIGLAYIRSRMRLSIYDNNHFQYQSGFMTAESWQPYLNLTKANCSRESDPGKVMLNHGEQFRKGFRDLCMNFINESELASGK